MQFSRYKLNKHSAFEIRRSYQYCRFKYVFLACAVFLSIALISFTLEWTSTSDIICIKQSNAETVCINIDKKFLRRDSYSSSNKRQTDKAKNAEAIEDNESANPHPETQTHPLENACKFPVLHPLDESLIGYTKKLDNYTCRKVLPDVVSLKNGILSLDQIVAVNEYGYDVVCRYRGLAGGLVPEKNIWKYEDDWVVFNQSTKPIQHSQFEVQCFNQQDAGFNNSIYKFAFSHVPPVARRFSTSNETFLSLDILLFDSTSMNAVRRHMPQTWTYFTNVMGALHLNAYLKVADNSMVNVIPLLTGLRYGNLSETMPSDYPLDKHLEWEKIPLLWKFFKAKNAVTMLNEDPILPAAGLFQVPGNIGRGFQEKPADYWYRPWNLYMRQNPIKNRTHLCFANDFIHNEQLKLVEQFTTMYKGTYHFSLTHFNEITHDRSNYLALIDVKMKEFLKSSFENGVFNKSVLLIIGDHGNRMDGVTSTFVGHIEERMPMFAIHFPEWFRKKHPKLIQKFRSNKNRLTTHFDTYQVLKNIADGNFDPDFSKNKNDPTRGFSLLHNIMKLNRSCEEADVPENHCICLIPAYEPNITKQIRRQAHDIILHYVQQKVSGFVECQVVDNIRIVNIEQFTINKLIQHGIRWMHPDSWDQVKNKTSNTVIDYFEVEFVMRPTNTTALIRLQKDNENELFFVNVEPLVLTNSNGCPDDKVYLPKFCKCL